MNDSNLREIPEDTGYSRPLLLSLGVHAVLAGLLWAGAMMHQTPEPQNTSIQSNSSIAGQPDPSLKSSAAPPGGANPQPILTTAGENQAKAVKAVPDSDGARSPTASAKTLSAAAQPKKPSRQELPESEKSPKPKHERVKLAAAKPAKPLPKTKGPAQPPRKTDAASSRRIAKAQPERKPKQVVVRKQGADRPDIAEIKKLESLRDAELRRISKSVS